MGAPLVSCLMPTRNRRRFVSRAIWYFLRQDYEHRELVIADDGEDRVADLVPSDPRIRYLGLPEPLSPEARREAAAAHATGELIAHWNDDAWYAPERLSVQVAALRRHVAVVQGGVLHYEPATGRVWSNDTRAGRHPATLAYRRGLPLEEPAVDDRDLAVIVLHGGAARPVNPADPRWRRRGFDELRRLLGADLAFYAGAERPGGAERAPLTLAGTFMVYDGYGSMAEYLALGMARAGADVHVMPFRIDPSATTPEFRELWRRSRGDPDGIVLCHAWWGENLARFGRARDLFVKTAWESSRLPADWPARLNLARAVFVPSRFAARVFQESGVTVPVEVVPEGVDPNVYPYLERPERRGPTTLVVGVLAERKNFRRAVAAWKLAFDGDPDARLILKARFQLERYVPDDPRIDVVDRNEATRGIAHWYRRADILLALGNEGFGLPLVEAMATGMPAVALDAEAQGDVCAEVPGAVLPVPPASWAPVDDPLHGPSGVRAIPDVEAAARQLRWVADHRAEALEMGRRASRWAHAHRNVWDLGPATLDGIERHARTSRPLRRGFAVWAPPGPGGVRYYAEDLTRTLSLTRLYETPPSAWRSRVLHVQHAPGLLADADLTAQLTAARDAGTRVIVTEHAVGATATAWEQCADVLVALDEAAAERLRERWPNKRVEVLPRGCPGWLEPTRDGSGRTVATIGTPSAAEEADRRALAALAPVLELDPLPASSAALAHRLNAEADAVVVWGGDEYLTRVAVASGVPVLLGRAAGEEIAGVAERPDDLADGVLRILDAHDDGLGRAAAREFCAAAGWPRIAALHDALWHTVCA